MANCADGKGDAGSCLKIKIALLNEIIQFMAHVDIIIASFSGALLGILLACGVAQKITSNLFVSARKACNMEIATKQYVSPDQNTEIKIGSAKV